MHLRRIVKSVTLVSLIVAISGISYAAEFSADFIRKTPKATINGKLFIQDGKLRQETNLSGAKQVVITRSDKKVVWVLNPEKKQYIEIPINTDTISQSANWEKRAKELPNVKQLGQETVNGFKCDKYQVTGEKGTVEKTVWVSKKLDREVKSDGKTPQGSLHTELKNIAQRKLPQSLFEIPKGYTKAEKPARKELKEAVPTAPEQKQ